ncbi:Restriction endonuclease fold toxin 9 [Pseudarcicella hirudinis]|uniref:Restriction endonuclease fold toxin 9 n=1 Tax=Pseudarcicella hirudinis TaxID=1079859 RepID=A0A1I5Z4E8_9BACT|nr:Restriction endonuclease fold toxin 9 [Pseudarcicella hirudinis]
MHKAYHAGKVGKEFRLLSGRRIDYLDMQNGIIYELKPNNPRAILQGQKQLQMYLQELQSPAMLQKYPQFKGIQWKTVLDTY